MEIEEAIIRGEIAIVHKAIPFHIGTSRVDDALRCAVRFGRLDMVEALLGAGADPDVREPDEEPDDPEPEPAARDMPREMSIEGRRLLAERLAEMGEYDHYRELFTWVLDQKEAPKHRTALICASEGDVWIVDDTPRFELATHAQRARWIERAQAMRLGIMDALIAAGADVNARDTAGRTPLFAAVCPTGIGALVVHDDGMGTPLGWGDSLPVVERLLAAGADVNVCDAFGNSPLLMMRSACWDTFQALLAAGADVNAQNSHGYTALLAAVTRKDSARTRALIDAGARVDVRDENGFAPMHYAVHEASESNRINPAIEIVDMLLAAGSDLGARAARGRTPLHIAAGSNAPREIIRALLDARAQPDAVDELGKTPLDLAVDQGNDDIVPLLARAGRG